MTGGGCSIVINVIAMTVLHERNPTYVVPAFRRNSYAVCVFVSALEQTPSATTDFRGYRSRLEAGTTITKAETTMRQTLRPSA
jgi:hypothetical protein